LRTVTLKVDVDTLRGTREGVPRLAALLGRLKLPASFLFSLGPDHTGRALKRVFRRGFLQKVRRTSVVSNYGIGTLLYGTLLPGPRIARRCRAEMRAVRDQGFEVGVHCWDHVKWQDGVAGASPEWTREQLNLAVREFEDTFDAAPQEQAGILFDEIGFVAVMRAEVKVAFTHQMVTDAAHDQRVIAVAEFRDEYANGKGALFAQRASQQAGLVVEFSSGSANPLARLMGNRTAGNVVEYD